MRCLLLLAVMLASPGIGRAAPFLSTYCVECHSAEKSKGDVSFEDSLLSNDLILAAIEQLENGDMPPKKAKKKPSDAETVAFIESLKSKLRGVQEKPRFAWMMRREHQRVMEALIRESDNKGDVSFVFSSKLPERMRNEFLMDDSQMDKNIMSGDYLMNAMAQHKQVLDRICPDPDERVSQWNFTTPADFTIAAPWGASIDENGVLRISPNGATLAWQTKYEGTYTATFDILDFKIDPGKYPGQEIIKINRKSVPVKKGTVTFQFNSKSLFNPNLKEYFTIESGHKPRGFRNRELKLPKNTAYVKEMSQTWVSVGNFSITGPENFDYVEFRRLLVFPESEFEKNVTHWVNKYHPIDSNPEPFIELYKKAAASRTSILAYKEVLLAILNDPRFFLLDTYGAEEQAYAQRIHRALTGRVGLPDEIANITNTSNPEAILKLLEDDQYLARTLANQWLSIENLNELEFDFADPGVRTFEKDLQAASLYSFIHEIIKANESIYRLVDTDFFMLNSGYSWFSPHYDIPTPSYELKRNKDVSGMNRIEVGPSRRAGVLTHPAVLTSISNGAKHPNPILRAAWVYKQILGRIPPEPPDVVEAIDESKASEKTDIRSLIEAHSNSESCMSCHKKFDGLGFVFSSYDGMGRYSAYVMKETKLGQLEKEDPVAAKEIKEKSKSVDPYRQKNLEFMYTHFPTDIKIDTSGGFFGGELKDVNDLSAYLTTGKGRDDFKSTLIIRLCESMLTRSLTATERLAAKEKVDLFPDKMRDLIIFLMGSSIIKGA